MTSKGIISVFAFRQGGKSRKKGLGKDKRVRCDTIEPKSPKSSDTCHNLLGLVECLDHTDDLLPTGDDELTLLE